MIEPLNVELHHENKSVAMCIVWELFKGGVYFVQFEPDNQCGNNSRAGRINEVQY